MAPGISYDDSGSLASYFGVTFLALILLPSTYLVLRPSKKASLKPLCPCSACKSRQADLAKSQGTSSRIYTRTLPILLGWALLAYFVYRIAQAPLIEGERIYNPFEILGISDSTTEKQIKKHYKKLSLQFHPDKIKLAENQTQEQADAKFVELTKAYKSLTDEVTRENLAKYGNPDGPQQREDKIAIPQWVVEGKNNIWVLGLYGLVLGGGIPFVVGRWWFSQRRLTRDGILNPTAELFFHYIREDTDFVSLVALLASAIEFVPLLAGKKRVSKKERKERQARIEGLEKELDAKREEVGIEDDPVMRKESKIGVASAAARRARALIWAHLLRHELEDKEQQEEQSSILRASPPLLTALLNISLAHNWLATSLLVVKLQAALVQALPPSISPLGQLPGVSYDDALELEIVKGTEGKKWCEKLVKKGLAEGETRVVAENWPRLEILDAEFKVVGEKIVTPSAIVSLSFKARYIYPTTSTSSSTPALEKPKLLPNGDSHGDEKLNGDAAESVAEVEDAITKVDAEDEKVDVKEKVSEAKEEIVASVEKAVGKRGKKVDEKRTWPVNGYAHAPRWPLLRKPHFQILLGDSKLDKVIVQPTRITDLPLPRPDGLPSEPRDFSLQFQAPPNANLYSFVLHAASDTFMGADLAIPIMLKVEDVPEDEDLTDDEDISEPEEDTLAGQMAMMRGGKVKPSAVHGHDSNDSGSGSEYESSSDEEGPKNRQGKAINEDSSDED